MERIRLVCFQWRLRMKEREGQEHKAYSVGSAFIPGQPPKRIFECVGMNVGKARIENGKLLSTSRELTYYLDPVTHRKLEKWENPWTGEKLPGKEKAPAFICQRKILIQLFGL